MSSPLHRAGAIATLAFLVAVPFAFAAGPHARPHKAAPLRPAVVKPAPLVVPNVLGQAYVFAEGSLEDSGFAWYVPGGNGFAADTVVAQRPAPGTRVVDTGAPLVTLRVERNRSYPQSGKADNKSPYHGTSLRLAP